MKSMKSRTIGKLCSAVLFGILFSLLMQHQFVSRREMAREDFLAKQAARYDRQIAKPTHYAFTLVASLVTVGVVFGAYELVGFGISKVAGKADDHDEVS